MLIIEMPVLDTVAQLREVPTGLPHMRSAPDRRVRSLGITVVLNVRLPIALCHPFILKFLLPSILLDLLHSRDIVELVGEVETSRTDDELLPPQLLHLLSRDLVGADH